MTRGGKMVYPPEDGSLLELYIKYCAVSFFVEKTFSPVVRYAIKNTGPEGEFNFLIEVVSMKTSNIWEVRNGTFFGDLDSGEVIGKVHIIESQDPLFAFVPSNNVLKGVPRLEIRKIKGKNRQGEFGEYGLFAGKNAKLVGDVAINLPYFDIEIRNCSREEALIWLTILVCIELEKKTDLVKYVSVK